MKAYVVLMFLVPTYLGLGDAESTLKKIQVIFRHGIRFPINSAWVGNDTCAQKNNDNSLGNLTQLGRSQMTMLGHVLRMHYNTLIGSDPNMIQMNYSITYRDQESAQLVSYGLFDQFNSSNVSLALLDSALDGPMALNETYYHNWLLKLPLKKDYQELCDSLRKNGSTNCTDMAILDRIADQLKSEVAEGCQLPSWLNEDVQKQLNSLDEAIFQFNIACEYKDLVKENSDLMLQYMNEVFKPGKDNKFKNVTLYAAHDSNIAMILTRLGMFNGLPVPFGSYLAFEQHVINNVTVVKVFYNNKTDYSGRHQLKVPNCDLNCPYDSFVKISQGNYKCFSPSLAIHTQPMFILILLFSVLSLAKNAEYL